MNHVYTHCSLEHCFLFLQNPIKIKFLVNQNQHHLIFMLFILILIIFIMLSMILIIVVFFLIFVMCLVFMRVVIVMVSIRNVRLFQSISHHFFNKIWPFQTIELGEDVRETTKKPGFPQFLLAYEAASDWKHHTTHASFSLWRVHSYSWSNTRLHVLFFMSDNPKLTVSSIYLILQNRICLIDVNVEFL
jgi:hypothetical protein